MSILCVMNDPEVSVRYHINISGEKTFDWNNCP